MPKVTQLIKWHRQDLNSGPKRLSSCFSYHVTEQRFLLLYICLSFRHRRGVQVGKVADRCSKMFVVLIVFAGSTSMVWARDLETLMAGRGI